MLQLPTDVRVFLSSTFSDLHETRAETARRLREVLGTQLISMETFGSDDVPPDIKSVHRVRECDIFVGIYARRYGSIARGPGKSITELELEEAEHAQSAGTLSAILLYLLDDDAAWPEAAIERGRAAASGLKRLRERAYRHTVTRFRRCEDLPFLVIRDVLGRVRDRLGGVTLAVRQQRMPEGRQLRRPVGMEFLTSAERHHLVGRGDMVDELVSCLSREPLVLLLGDSGVGKTSLIHGGLFPRLVDGGWRLLYTRPLGFPATDVVIQVQASVFEGTPWYRGPLLPILGEIVAAVSEQRILLVIDQFEDVLTARDVVQTEKLIADLRAVRELSDPSLRVLVCYRADLEGRLGRLWQLISGAPQGLPRIYVGGILARAAWNGVLVALSDLGVHAQFSSGDTRRLTQDLVTASQSIGQAEVYPPYVQMFVDHVWRAAGPGRKAYGLKDYIAAGGMNGVIGGYLERQLKYAQDTGANLRAVLAALVRSYGSRAQRSLVEVSTECALTDSECEVALEQLIDLRLVRHIGDYYEVAHDFLARRIMDQLVDSDEREFKRFRELLSSKAAAFDTTSALLTAEELLMLFKHKERLIPSEPELRLLAASWVREKGPALFWLVNVPRAQVCNWLKAENDRDELSASERVGAVLLRRKVGNAGLDEVDWAAFRKYQLAAEFAAVIAEDPAKVPDCALLHALRSQRSNVRAAALEALAQRIKPGNWSWISKLRSSSSASLQSAYECMILDPRVPSPPSNQTERALAEFRILKQLAGTADANTLNSLIASLKSMRPRQRSSTFAEALALIRRGQIRTLLGRARRASAQVATVYLGAIDDRLNSRDFEQLLDAYNTWSSEEASRESPARRAKAVALAQAILRASRPSLIPALRTAFQGVELTHSAESVALALITHGALPEYRLVLKRVETTTRHVEYWHHMGLANAATKQLRHVTKRIPSWLRKVTERREFWEYLMPGDRADRREILPITNRENRALYIRLVAGGLTGLGGLDDRELFCRLARHPYRLVARAAAIRLVQLSGRNAFRALADLATDVITGGNADSFAAAVRDAEFEFHGLAQLS